jgi:predicted nucleic acid-binding protein
LPTSDFLIDANIFLELQLEQSRSAECKEFLSLVSSGKVEAATTDFILDSIAVVMEDKKATPEDIRKFFVSLSLFKGLYIHNLDLRGRIAAAQKMADEDMDFDDSTSIVAMEAMNIKKIVSLDRDFDGISGIARVEPRQAIAKRQDGTE